MVVGSLGLGVLGAALSVPVARFVADEGWWANTARQTRLDGVIDSPPYPVSFSVEKRPGDHLWISHTWAPMPPGESLGPGANAYAPVDDPRPAMARATVLSQEPLIMYHESGWPMRAARGRWSQAAGNREHTDWLITVNLLRRSVQVPLQPMPLGLAANTLFYGGPALAVWTLLRRIRVRRRHGRGRCIACGYQLGDGVATCPECGLAAEGG